MSSWILVVDDEHLVRENIKAYLEDEGMTVMAVASGEEALRCVQAGHQFAVCVMDMRLPGMDGNASIRSLHRLCPGMQFIIHTGSASYTLPDDLATLSLGAPRIYFKPLPDMQPLATEIRWLTQSSLTNAES